MYFWEIKDASEEVEDIEEETKNLKPSYWKVQFMMLLECVHNIIKYLYSHPHLVLLRLS